MSNHDWDDDKTPEEGTQGQAAQKKILADFLLGDEGQRMLKLQDKFKELRELESLEKKWESIQKNNRGFSWHEKEALLKMAKGELPRVEYNHCPRCGLKENSLNKDCRWGGHKEEPLLQDQDKEDKEHMRNTHVGAQKIQRPTKVKRGRS